MGDLLPLILIEDHEVRLRETRIICLIGSGDLDVHSYERDAGAEDRNFIVLLRNRRLRR